MTAELPTLLITGAAGQIGRQLAELAPAFGFRPLLTDIHNLDITKVLSVEAFFATHQIDGVVNCAAYTQVDRAEAEPELAFLINETGASNLAKVCERLGLPIFHISTDYVFGGDQTGFYSETDQPAPLNVYGASKLAGEEAIISNCSKYTIIRTSWVYGVHGNNFVKTMLKLAKGMNPIRVVNDQFGCPTYSADIADVILRIFTMRDGDSSRSGIYHYCGTGSVNWFEFAQKIFLAAYPDQNQQIDVRAVGSEYFKSAAQRPRNSSMATDKIKTVFGIEPYDWKSRCELVAPIIKNTLLSEV